MSNKILFILFFLVGCSKSSLPIQEEEPVVVETPTPIIPPKRPAPLIMIDPGHGGEDQGTHSLFKPTYQEKSLTLATAVLLKDYLKKLGYQVKMTRTEDIFIALSDRAKMANEANAVCFVSVHYNSAPSTDAHGIEIFYYESETNTGRTTASKNLAKKVLDEIIPLSQAKSRGVKAGNFAVIRETKMPAILVEGGFLTNQKELEKIKDPQYLKALAWGIARGVDGYLKSKSPL